MQNVKVSRQGSKLIIEIDTAAQGTASASGKSVVLASTKGNKDVGDGLMLGVNCYRSAK